MASTIDKIGFLGIVKDIRRKEGYGGFYKGIRPAWAREAAEKSFRLGMYDPVKIMLGADAPGTGVLRKFLAGAIAAVCGSIAGTPFDVLKTRTIANQGKDSKSIKALIYEIWTK